MIRFQNLLLFGYFVLAVASYPLIKNHYFSNEPTIFEKLITVVLCSVWLLSVPVTMVLKQDHDDEVDSFETSYEGFVGSEV